MIERKIGQVVYVKVNRGRGISVARLISRHDETSWDCDVNPGGFHRQYVVVSDDDIR